MGAELGGPIDPNSEAQDLIISVFGGMSKGERNRIKIRARAAMAAQARIEGRYLGGRPSYGYQLADAGPHPHPGKAAHGKRLHRLEPDPGAAPVVQRIFSSYLSGADVFAITQQLTFDDIAQPLGPRPRPKPSPIRYRVVQERCSSDPHQTSLHRLRGLEQTTKAVRQACQRGAQRWPGCTLHRAAPARLRGDTVYQRSAP